MKTRYSFGFMSRNSMEYVAFYLLLTKTPPSPRASQAFHFKILPYFDIHLSISPSSKSYINSTDRPTPNTQYSSRRGKHQTIDMISQVSKSFRPILRKTTSKKIFPNRYSLQFQVLLFAGLLVATLAAPEGLSAGHGHSDYYVSKPRYPANYIKKK